MGTTYELADVKVLDMIQDALVTYHPALVDAGVKISCVMARKIDDESGELMQAVKRAGYPAAAKIAVVSLEDRARGGADAKLVIDDYAWQKLSDTRRIALLDHELTHLELKHRNVKGAQLLARDDLGRPKLKLRPHDFELGFFADVVERHGEAAPELTQIRLFQETWGQLAMFAMPGTTEFKPSGAAAGAEAGAAPDGGVGNEDGAGSRRSDSPDAEVIVRDGEGREIFRGSNEDFGKYARRGMPAGASGAGDEEAGK